MSTGFQQAGRIVIFAIAIIFFGCSKEGLVNTPTPSSAKSLNSVVFTKIDNPTLAVDLVGQLTGDTIRAEVPAGVSLLTLIPTISHTGVTIAPANRTAQNFTTPVTYTIKAEDNSERNYVFALSQAILDTTAAIQTIWKILKDSIVNINFYYPNGLIPNGGVYIGVPADYMEFQPSGVYKIFENGNAYTGPYAIINNAIIRFYEGFNYDGVIKYLTTNKLTLGWDMTSPNGGRYSRTLYLYR
jgi:hypothetical protein